MLPDTIADLAMYDRYYSARQPTYRKLLRSVTDWAEASEEEKRILKRAQDEAEYLIDIRAKLGELTARMEKAKNQHDAITNNGESKRERLESMGLDPKHIDRYEALADPSNQPIIEQAKAEARENHELVTQSAILKAIKAKQKAEEIDQAMDAIANEISTNPDPPILTIGNGIGYVPDQPYDLLLTDPPYSTDVDDIDAFARSWLPNALEHVRDTGFAYVFIGAYPNELKAYLNTPVPKHMKLKQVLVWTYKNTLGNNPKDRYKLNYQVCLFYSGVNAPILNCPLTSEQWAVQEVNAPDGRVGDRLHVWQKPIGLAERFIRHSTTKGMTVFDPFACTGTFLVAASILGRKAYGFEINPDNAKIAYQRGCVSE